MTTVGLLYPGHSAEDDFALLESGPGQAGADRELQFPLQHTSVGEDAHRVDALLDLGSPARLADGARELTERIGRDGTTLDSLMWACTSGSFVFGWDGAREQVDRLAELTGLPASSTSIAFANACSKLGLTRVAVAASYPADVAEHFVAFLGAAGVQVSAMGSHGIITAAEVGTLGREDVMAIATGVDATGAEAVLIPDTAMHTLSWIDDLEQATGLPVLTANQVTAHEGLALAGSVPALPTLGTLFRTKESGRRGPADEHVSAASGD